MTLKILRKSSVLALCLLGFSAQADEAIDPQRGRELVYLLHQDCGSCHGMTLKGGLGPSLLPSALAGKPDAYLRQVIARGVPGTAMPPWDAILNPSEIDFLVAYLTDPATAAGVDP